MVNRRSIQGNRILRGTGLPPGVSAAEGIARKGDAAIRPPHSGFALLDVIIGTIILAVSLAAILGLTGHAISSQSAGQDLQTAAMLADEQLALVLARGPDDYKRRFGTSGPCDAPFASFRYELAFQGGSGATPYTVTATISWAPSGAKLLRAASERSLTIQTMIAAREGDEPDPDRKPPDVPSRLQ